MRSVVVVLPASMCAMIPMLRVFSRGNSRAISVSYFGAVSFSGRVVSGGGQQSTGHTRLLGARSGNAGRTPLGVTARLSPFGRLPYHCSDHHVLIVPFGRSTSG